MARLRIGDHTERMGDFCRIARTPSKSAKGTKGRNSAETLHPKGATLHFRVFFNRGNSAGAASVRPDGGRDRPHAVVAAEDDVQQPFVNDGVQDL